MKVGENKQEIHNKETDHRKFTWKKATTITFLKHLVKTKKTAVAIFHQFNSWVWINSGKLGGPSLFLKTAHWNTIDSLLRSYILISLFKYLWAQQTVNSISLSNF